MIGDFIALGDAQPDGRDGELVFGSEGAVVVEEGVEVVSRHPVRCAAHVEGGGGVEADAGDVGHGEVRDGVEGEGGVGEGGVCFEATCGVHGQDYVGD